MHARTHAHTDTDKAINTLTTAHATAVSTRMYENTHKNILMDKPRFAAILSIFLFLGPGIIVSKPLCRVRCDIRGHPQQGR